VREFLGDFGSELRDIELHRALDAMNQDDRELVEAGHAMLGDLDRMLAELTSLMDEVSATGAPRDRLESVEAAYGGTFEMSPRKRRRNRWRAW
jgi:hypothetical protein